MAIPIIPQAKFGRWTVIEYVGPDTQGPYGRWLCRCECGTTKIVAGRNLRFGTSTSCGCYCVERVTKHGLSRSPEYGIWNGMIQRCCNPNDRAYKSYGGRGITVCDRWLDSFKNFYDDMGPRTSDQHSLDRRDNDGNYEPGNCRWATHKEQQQNTRLTRRVTIGDETMCLAEWSRRLGCKWNVVSERLKNGWSEEDAVTIPLRPRKPNGTRRHSFLSTES